MVAAPRRVLVVDDEPGIRRIFSMALANYGFAVDCAASAAEAFVLLDGGTYDVLVSDVHMPSGNGIDLLGLMRNRGIHIPVIVMSGRPSPEGRARALGMGAFRYLVKPIMPSELRVVLEGALASTTPAVPSSPQAGRGAPAPRRP